MIMSDAYKPYLHHLEKILIFLIVILASTYVQPRPDDNARSRLALVRAVVEEHRFEIDSFHEGTVDKSFYNGHYYTDKAIGSSLAGIAFYYTVERISTWIHRPPSREFVSSAWMTLIPITVPVALIAPLIYDLVKRITARKGYALIVALSISIGTPFYIYGAAYYGHSLAGACLFAAFHIWYRARDETRLPSIFSIILSGFLLGFAVTTEYPSAVLGLLIGFYILYVLWEQARLTDWRSYLFAAIGGSIPIGIMLLYNTAVYGIPLTIGYSHEASDVFFEGMQSGLMGIGPPNIKVLFYTTFHTAEGVFWQSPVLILAFAGWFAMSRARTHLPEQILSLAMIAIYFVMLSGFYLWWGGFSFTPRHLIPVMPFFAIPLALVPDRLRKISPALSLIAIIQMLMVIASQPHDLRMILRQFQAGETIPMFTSSTIYSAYVPSFFSGDLHPNLGSELLHLNGLYSLRPLIAAEVILLILFLITTRAPSTESTQE